MPTTLNSGLQLPDKGSVDWYGSMQTNYNLLDNHLENTDTHVTAEDKANWNSKQGSLSQAQLDAIAQVATNTSDIATLQSGKANASHTHSSSDITDIGDYATKQYVDNSISGLVDSAPNALDTLNELAAALNDDANFASTVATALSAKANSADLATVATSGSYNDLSNKPSIPTKTSDLTNDSNFVDTSNSAVASGITSAKVTSYDAHIANTDIHVTTADKTKWNNGVTQAYVFRYSGMAVVPNSTIAYSTIDNTDNIKSGDKILDVDGKLFEITAVDTANQTVTVGSALIDLALDANVVHTNRNDDVSIPLNSTSAELGVTGGSTNITFLDKNDKKLSGLTLGNYGSSKLSYARLNIFDKDTNNNEIQDSLEYAYVSNNNNAYLRVSRDNFCALGTTSYRWKSVYAMNYYYGSNNVEFSTKFVTTDTDQTISGTKTFGNGTLIVNNGIGSNVHGEIKLNGSRSGYIVADNASDGVFNNAGCGVSILLQDAGKPLHVGGYKVDSNGRVFADNTNKNPVLSITSSLIKTATLVPENDTVNSVFRILSQIDYANGNTSKTLDVRFIQYDNANATSAIYSNDDGKTALGTSSRKWSNVLTYKVNDVEPSSLGMPSDRSARVDISGYFTNMGNGGINQYTAVANGFIYLKVSDVVTMHMMSLGSNTLSNYADTKGRNSTGLLYGLFPVRKDDIFTCEWYTTATNVTLDNAYFIPCQGNI